MTSKVKTTKTRVQREEETALVFVDVGLCLFLLVLQDEPRMLEGEKAAEETVLLVQLLER